MIKIFCDIGGTHIRFAHKNNHEPLSLPRKSVAAQYKNLIDAVRAYVADEHIDPMMVTHFYFAFSNRNAWVTDDDHIRALLPVAKILQVNDFEANAYGIAHASNDECELLHKGTSAPPPQSTRVVLGVGTGLGLAYITGDHKILRTHGGHMLPTIISAEQKDLFDFIQSQKDTKTQMIFEDVVSGAGLYKTYLYLCERLHLDAEFRSIEDIMTHGLDHPIVAQALGMFYDLLGLFMHQAVAFGYAYAGIYLTGGMIDKLRYADKIDMPRILKSFHQRNVPIVIRDVESTNIYWVKDEFISLHGLNFLSDEQPA